MAAPYAIGDNNLQAIADAFRVHYAGVSRSVNAKVNLMLAPFERASGHREYRYGSVPRRVFGPAIHRYQCEPQTLAVASAARAVAVIVLTCGITVIGAGALAIC